ncbi:hypothetical protein D7W81_26970, partial [Corallococcus aberystwythensis]
MTQRFGRVRRVQRLLCRRQVLADAVRHRLGGAIAAPLGPGRGGGRILWLHEGLLLLGSHLWGRLRLRVHGLLVLGRRHGRDGRGRDGRGDRGGRRRHHGHGGRDRVRALPEEGDGERDDDRQAHGHGHRPL